MAKALITVPIDLTESDATGAVLKASENSRLLVFGKTLLGVLTAFIGAPAWAIRNLNAALSGATVTRTLHVVKKGTRFFVTQDTANGVNLAEEAQLQFKSFGSFGEFVRRCLDGEIAMGSTPATQGTAEVKGTIVLEPTFTAGNLSSSGVVELMSDAGAFTTLDPSPSIAQVVELLENIGTVQVEDPQSGTGPVTFTITLTQNTVQAVLSESATGTQFATGNRQGYVAPVAPSAGQPANAISLDQVAGTVRFVYIPAIPAGTDLLNLTRDTATLTSIFE